MFYVFLAYIPITKTIFDIYFFYMIEIFLLDVAKKFVLQLNLGKDLQY